MPEPSEVAYLKPFIESTIDAAARFRRVLIVMTIASILAFGAWWNSLEETWFNSRIAAARSGEAYLNLKDISKNLARLEQDIGGLWVKAQQEGEEKGKRELEVKIQEANKNRESLLSEAEKILKDRFGKELIRSKVLIQPNESIQPYSSIQRKESIWSYVLRLLREHACLAIKIIGTQMLERVLQGENFQNEESWLKQRMIPNREQAGIYAQKLEEARTANILLIHIPFSGNVFDVNTLGLWGGITFMVMLLMFRFSLWREYNNLKLAFQEAKTERLRYCYLSLAMQQVLTVPPALYPYRPHLMPRGRVIQLLYFPPVLIQSAIIINDIRTESIGEIFSSFLALISIGLSMLLLAPIVKLTLSCLKLSAAIDNEWMTAAAKVNAALQGDEATPPQ
jgi:hypothetical protein